MEAKGLFNVARKEFIDHLTSKRFIIILGLFLIISALAMHQGRDYYNNMLENGAILAIAMGFDLVSGEKETRA